MTILSRSEIAALDKGKRTQMFVEAHSRSVLRRSPQVMKNKRIYDFAMSFINQLRKHGISPGDRRHIRNLIVMLTQEVDNAG